MIQQPTCALVSLARAPRAASHAWLTGMEDEEGARTPPSIQKEAGMQYLGWPWCHHLQEPSERVTLQTDSDLSAR